MHQLRKNGPPIVGWEITAQCNLSCPHCYSAAAKRPHDELTMEECRQTIEAMSRIGVGMIGWTGGEPLLCEELEELMIYAGERNIKSSITTNGVLLDEARILSLKKAGISSIQISIDGATPEVHHRMRLTTDEEFSKIIEAIHLSKKHNIKLFIATLVGQENLDDAREMIEMVRREGLERIRFCGFTPVGRGKGSKIKDRLAFNERMRDLYNFALEAQLDGMVMPMFDPPFGPVPPGFDFHECIAGKETFYLKSNGDVFPCTSLLNKEFRVGNIRQRPLEEIWNDPAIETIADFPREKIEGHCRDCDNFSRCRGACRGVTFAHTGNLTASFPVCLYRVALDAAVEK